jgi:hypothetical protein
METATVKAIKQRAVKSGEGAKGPWQQDIVILDTGEEVRIFAPIEVGDPVESYDNEYNGKTYKNWRLADGHVSTGEAPKPRPAADGTITTDQIYAEVLKHGKMLKEILDRQKVLMGEIDEVESDEVKNDAAAIAADKAAAEAEPDVVIEDIGDEPINLDDIPF